MKRHTFFALGILFFIFSFQPISAETLRYHELKLDAQNKIIPWYSPVENAFDNYLKKCWEWAIAVPKDNHNLPISYLYCAWSVGNPPSIDYNWENDIGEKIPNWVENARLFYQYTGDMSALTYVKGLVDYSLVHGQTPSNHAWPDFPVGTSNAGDTEFRGFTGVWKIWDCHVDLAADIAWSLTTMYEIYGDQTYLNKAKHVADLLAANIQPGDETHSPWPYVINSLTGANKSRYAASWDGALMLFDYLIENNQGNTANYIAARTTLTNWLLTYPMQNGKWVDGHSDVYFDGNTNLSTTCASDMMLYMFNKPSWDSNFTTDIPKLFKWIEDNFVNDGNYNAFPGKYYGAWVPGEQVAFTVRMGYQSARVGGMAAQWYLKSGDVNYKDLGYRCLSFNTYMMQSNGQSSDGPTNDSGWWWSDCYGEAPRMYYYGLGAVPEWAPMNENHILYSDKSLKNIDYSNKQIKYNTDSKSGIEYLRTFYVPGVIKINGVDIPLRTDLEGEGYTLRSLGNGDYAVSIKRAHSGLVELINNNPIVHVTSVALNKSTEIVNIGLTIQLTATIFPLNADNKKISWTSSNESIATVSAFGEVNGVSKGKVTITATTEDGGITASCELTVVNEGYRLFTTQVPQQTDNDSDYELGMKFQSSIAGYVTKIRFYKVTGESGTHTGRLWTSSGIQLGSVAFTGESPVGWQEAALSSPIFISPNTTYVVSVNANFTYGFTQYGLETSVVNGPLSSVADGINGLEHGTPGTFPTVTWNKSNYFRDVVFVTEISTGGLTFNATGLNIILNPIEGTISIEGKSTTTILIFNLAGVLVNQTKLKANQQPIKLYIGKGIYLVKDLKTGEVKKVKL